MVNENHLRALDEAVREALEQGRVGLPSFVRCVAVTSGDGLEGILEDVVTLVEGWFDGPHRDRHRRGDDGRSHVAEMLRWEDGRGALILVGSPPAVAGPELDLMLIGSRGTIYHQA